MQRNPLNTLPTKLSQGILFELAVAYLSAILKLGRWISKMGFDQPELENPFMQHAPAGDQLGWR